MRNETEEDDVIEYDGDNYEELLQALEDLIFDLLDIEGVTEDQIHTIVVDIFERYRW